VSGQRGALPRGTAATCSYANKVTIYNCRIIDTKFVESPRSPYVPGSGVPDFIQAKIDAQQASEMSRYAAVINDGTSSFTDLRVVTNSNAAVPYFENLMSVYDVPGEVVVKPAP
jgi:hypothetical protein